MFYLKRFYAMIFKTVMKIICKSAPDKDSVYVECSDISMANVTVSGIMTHTAFRVSGFLVDKCTRIF